MQIKTFYKTQRELATAINYLVDSYWDDEIEEDVLVENIKNLYINNPSKMIKNHKFTTILKQHSGKRRLEVVIKVLGIDLSEEI